MNDQPARGAFRWRPCALGAGFFVVFGLLAAAPHARADGPHASTELAPTDVTEPAPGDATEPASADATEPVVGDASVPSPPAADSGSATEPERTPAAAPEYNAFGRGFVWGGTVAPVALVWSMVLEVGVLPPLADNGWRILLLMAGSLGLATGVGALAGVFQWPEQGALAVSGAGFGAFVFAPFGILIDGASSSTSDGLDTGPFTVAASLVGAAVGGVLAPLLLDANEPAEAITLSVAPGAGAFLGTLVWLGLWIFGAIRDDPATSSRALVASAGIGGTLGLSLPFLIHAVRAANE